MSDAIGLIAAESIRSTAGESAGRASLDPVAALAGDAGKSAGERVKGFLGNLGR